MNIRDLRDNQTIRFLDVKWHTIMRYHLSLRDTGFILYPLSLKVYEIIGICLYYVPI